MGAEDGSAALLEPVLDALPSPKLLIEPGTGRLLYANPAAHRLAAGADPPDVIRRAANGEALHGVAADWETPAGRRSLLVSADAVSLPGVAPVVLVTFEDVTELEAARRRTALLAEAGRRLGGSLDPAEVAAAIAGLVVPEYADRCAIDLGADGAAGVPLRAHGRVIGTLVLERDPPGQVDLDAETLQELADRCALALDNARLYTELSAAGEEINSILGGVADAVTAQGPDGTLVYANGAAVELIGYGSVEELLAAPIMEVAGRFEMLDEHLQPLAVEQLPGRRALLGEHPEPLIVRSRMAGARETRWTRVKATPLLDENGRVRLAINVVEDITEIKRAELGQKFLADAGRALAASLEYRDTLAAVARLAVPDIADWCAVDMTANGALERLAVAHVDPEKLSAADEIARRYPPDPDSPTGVHAVLRTGRSELYADITDDMLVASARDDEHLAMLRSIGMRSVMVVPIGLRGEVFGAISFVSAEAGHQYTDADLELAENLASHAAAAIENARLYEARSSIARTLQASLLPPALPEVPGIELAAAYRAAASEVGGDFYDVFPTAEDQWYAVIGDVCGKGPEAAAVTAMARYTIRAAAVRRRSPAAILRLLSEAMLRQASPEQEGRFCTIACLHLDLSGTPARVTVACGGHPPPALLRAGGAVEEIGEPGTLLGLVERPELQDHAGELRPGDTLVLYTDGLTEAGAPAVVWEPEDLAAVLGGAAGRPAQEIVDHVVGAVLDVQPEPRDDIAVVALKALGSG